jgi:GntR family transcriptional repressor for pyruvate dehydrogenase complex
VPDPTPSAPRRIARADRRPSGDGALERPRKTALLLAQRIVSEISEDQLPAGTVLLTEREMLARYGVARGTLREALRFLEMHDVLAIKPGPGGGALVKEPEPRVLASSMALLLQLSHARFSVIVETREVLEPVLARMAARHATDDDIAALEQSLASMEAQLDDANGFLAENRSFHDIVAAAGGNALLVLLLRSLLWTLDATVLGVEYDSRRRRAILQAHTAIALAIAAHDEEAAGVAMAAHTGEFARYLKRHYAHVLDKPVRWDESVS